MAQTRSRAVEVAQAREQQIIPRESVVRLSLPLFDGGINTAAAPEDIKDNQCVSLLNLRMLSGRLEVDTGYVPFGGGYAGQAENTYQAFFSDGTTVELLVTSSSVYRYNAAVAQWQLVSWLAEYEVNGAAIAGATAITLDSTAGIVATNTVGITLGSGVQFITTVASVVGFVVNLDAPLPDAVADEAVVVLSVPLTGDLTAQIQVKFVQFPANEWVIFTNGVQPVLYYFNNVVKVLGGLPGNNTTCLGLLVAHEQLLLINTTEATVPHPLRIRASDQADPETWTPGSGLAAIYDQLDTSDPLLAIEDLGPYVIVYRTATIMRGTYLGQLNATWFWEYMVNDEGIVSQSAVVNLRDRHAFVGHGGIYYYTGGYSVVLLDADIFTETFSAKGELNPATKRTIFSQYVPDLDEAWFFYPADQAQFPSTMVRLVLTTGAWYKREFALSFVGARPRLETTETTWATVVGTWADHPEQWNSLVATKNVPNILLTTPSQQQVFVYDYAALLDGGTSISWQLVTKQYGDGSVFTRWERLVLVGIGTGILVEFSIDEGVSWTTLETVNLSGVQVFVYVYIDRATTRMQFRLSGSDSTFQLRYGRLTGVVEAEW